METTRSAGGWRTGLKISLAYALFGFLWIAYSDRFLESMSSDPGFITQMQTYKGWAYVLVTACLVLVLVRHFVNRLLRSFDLLRESESRYRALLESAPDAMIVANHAGEIALVNARTEAMFGYARDELVGRQIEMLIPEPFQKGHEALRNAFVASAATRQMGSGRDLLALRKDGSVVPVDVGLSPLQIEEGMLISAAVRDITERQRAEQDLRQTRDAAQQAAREAEDANRSKSVFLANVSHEIRTPMNAILGFADILDQEIRDPRQKEYLASIQNSGRSLIGLLTDILDLSRAHSGGLDLEEAPTATKQLFVDLETAFRIRARQQGLAFEVDLDHNLPGAVVVDEKKLRRILDNLLDNAVKFTTSGGVRVSVRATPCGTTPRAVDLCVDVEDTGPGIPPDQIDAVFQAFTQKKGQSINEFGGTGVGLALARAFVAEMKGEIQAESQVGVGSTFRVTLGRLRVVEESTVEGLALEATPGRAEEAEGEAPDWRPTDLSEAARSRLPELVGQLEEMSAACDVLSHTLTINDVDAFADEVARLGEAGELPPVAEWGHRLAEQVEVFDMDGMRRTLESFAGLLHEIRAIPTE